MQCERCNGEVTWRGPFSDLTHTECSSCGGINCQRVAGQDEPDDSDMNQVHAGGVDMTALPDNVGGNRQ